MAEQRDLPSDSDESDVDFKPSDEESLPSEEDSDGCVEDPALDNEEEQLNTSRGKRKKKQTRRRKKIKKHDVDDTENNDEKTEETKILSAEEEKKKADSLWNDFMKDSTSPTKQKLSHTGPNTQSAEVKALPSNLPSIEKENKAVVVTEIFEFAGEKVKIEKEVPVLPSGRGRGGAGLLAGRGGRGRGGIASIIGQLGKKNKLSTLEKSKLDWDRFKKDQGIQEDLQRHNKGKEGYLEKQDFLQRADLRQFEIEKQLRTSKSNR